jgi:GT2 family glycosyltransferase
MSGKTTEQFFGGTEISTYQGNCGESEVKTRRSALDIPAGNQAPRFDDGRAPVVSIIMLTYDQLDCTKTCIESIERFTPPIYEIIFVDNGSSDGTLDHLWQVAHRLPRVRLVANRQNHGFAKGNNQGLCFARGKYVLLLNNDTVVTPGWLEGMISVFERYPRTGLVGPTSNMVAGAQLVPDVSYRDLTGLLDFASQRSTLLRGQTHVVPGIIAFCLLLKKEVVVRLGSLDEIYGTGNFEDMDYCVRADLSGFEMRIALDVFVHHEGHKSFKSTREISHCLQSNWDIFKKKWKVPRETPYGAKFYIDRKATARVPIKLNLPDLRKTHTGECSGLVWKEK